MLPDAFSSILILSPNFMLTLSVSQKYNNNNQPEKDEKHYWKALYENGIFSTFLPGDQIPREFIHYIDGVSISYTVPLLPNLKIRGLNVFAVYTKSDAPSRYSYSARDPSLRPIMAQVDNKTSGVAWTYGPLYYGVPSDGEDVTWLSHWKFGDQLRGGDEVDFLVLPKPEILVKKCGIQVVYEQGERSWRSYTEDPFYPNVIAGEASVYGFKWDRRGTYLSLTLRQGQLQIILPTILHLSSITLGASLDSK